MKQYYCISNRTDFEFNSDYIRIHKFDEKIVKEMQEMLEQVEIPETGLFNLKLRPGETVFMINYDYDLIIAVTKKEEKEEEERIIVDDDF